MFLVVWSPENCDRSSFVEEFSDLDSGRGELHVMTSPRGISVEAQHGGANEDDVVIYII